MLLFYLFFYFERKKTFVLEGHFASTSASGVLSAQSDRGFYHYRRAAVSAQLKSKVGLALPVTLRITLNLDGVPIISRTHSPITLANISSINVISIFRCSSSTRNPVYVRRVDSSSLVFSLSSHRHSYIGLVFNSHFID